MRISIILVSGLAALLAACGGDKEDEKPKGIAATDKTHPRYPKEKAPAAKRPTLKAPPAGVSAESAIVGRDGGVIGRAMMTDGPNGMLLRVDIEGLSEGFHGLHLHQIGDCSDNAAGFKASGGHINPEGKAHGLLNPDGPDMADLPNIYAGPSGHARAEFFSPGLTAAMALDGDGFAVVVHQNQDDHQTQPIGGAGPRVACAPFRPL